MMIKQNIKFLVIEKLQITTLIQISYTEIYTCCEMKEQVGMAALSAEPM